MLNDVREQREGVHFLRQVVDGKLASPLLLVGNEGVGKCFSVVQAAKESFSKGNPQSFHCVRIDSGTHPDLLVVQPTDKEIGVDTIREVVDHVGSYPSMVSVRYVVLDGADRMTTAASNALLKTLEDPPITSRFFLTSTSVQDVLPTIRSRCGLVRYKPLSENFITAHLLQYTSDSTKALVCARLSEGSVSRAYQFLTSGRLNLRNNVLGLIKIGISGDLSLLFSSIDAIEEDLQCGILFFEHILHDLVMPDPSCLINLDVADQLQGLREDLGVDRVVRLVSEFQDLREKMRVSTSINLLFHFKTYLATAFE